MNDLRVSVIIPMYNDEKTILRALDSVIYQTVPVHEIIVVNDGSTDRSQQIVEDYILRIPQKKVKLINKDNEGVSKARNIGMKAADADWIAFLDADDYWHLKKIEIVCKYLTPDTGLICHDFILDKNIPLSLEKFKIKYISTKQLLFKNYFVTPSVILRNQHKYYFDESMHYTEDHDLWLEISEKNKIQYIDLPLVILNRPVLSAGGASSNRWGMRLGELKMYRKFFSRNLHLAVLYPFFVILSILKHFKAKVFM